MQDWTEEQKNAYASRRARKRRLYRMRQRAIEVLVLAVLITAVAIPVLLLLPDGEDTPVASVDSHVTDGKDKVDPPAMPSLSSDTYTLTDEVDAQYAILVDVTDNLVVADKNADMKVYPASVSKVMTLLVAVENITDFTDTFTMTYQITDPLYVANATVAGFSADEEIVLEDLLYGTILPSGADACQALALYVAGTEEAFVQMMNDRAKTMGLKNTHFANTSGLHDAEHYTTCEDTAIIMREAMKNPHCRQVLSTYQYTTASTPQHPEGLLLTSTMFSRMRGDEPEGALVVAGKTGYTTEAGHTMVSYAVGEDNHHYVLVTMDGTNRWKATYDAIDMYTMFCSVMTAQTDAETDATSQ